SGRRHVLVRTHFMMFRGHRCSDHNNVGRHWCSAFSRHKRALEPTFGRGSLPCAGGCGGGSSIVTSAYDFHMYHAHKRTDKHNRWNCYLLENERSLLLADCHVHRRLTHRRLTVLWLANDSALLATMHGRIGPSCCGVAHRSNCYRLSLLFFTGATLRGLTYVKGRRVRAGVRIFGSLGVTATLLSSSGFLGPCFVSSRTCSRVSSSLVSIDHDSKSKRLPLEMVHICLADRMHVTRLHSVCSGPPRHRTLCRRYPTSFGNQRHRAKPCGLCATAIMFLLPKMPGTLLFKHRKTISQEKTSGAPCALTTFAAVRGAS
ncbi:unnamed protein product, partial [Ectocarpus sp. 12 AP-2014]